MLAFSAVPTSLQFPAKTVDRLCELARQNLAENKEFRRLVRDLRAAATDSDSPDQPSFVNAR